MADAKMKKFPLIIGMVIGAFVGLLTSMPDGLGLKVVMMSIGAVAGIAIGGAFCKTGKNSRRVMREVDDSYGQGTSAEDRVRNFWRDKGKVPFSGSANIEGSTHDFDPDRQ